MDGEGDVVVRVEDEGAAAEAGAEAAVEIAEIQAETAVELAEIHAETEQHAAELRHDEVIAEQEAEIEEWRTKYNLLSSEVETLKTAVERLTTPPLVLETSPEPPNPNPNPDVASVDPTPASPEAEPKPEPEPVRKRPRFRLI